jgi:hypothetical protein
MLEDILRTIFNAPPTRRKVMEDIEVMRKETRECGEKLYPWIANNELDLLSLNQSHKWVNKGGKMLKGVLYSIYNEPMVVIGYKNYLRNGLNTLTWISTRKHEIVYRGTKSRTEFFIDREPVGHITPDGLMYGGSKGRLLGRRNNFSEDHYSIVIWDKEVAHLLKPDRVDRVNPRAFEVLETMSEKEELLLLAIGMWTILQEIFELDKRGR